MPNNKKKKSRDKKKKKQERLERQEAAQTLSHALSSHSDQFRQLLLQGRKEYAKGRAYEAQDLQLQAIAYGTENLPRFNDYSMVKAHALIEVGLTRSAILTDFCTDEEERKKVQKTLDEAFQEALRIYQHRIEKKTLTKFRRDECWMNASGTDYISPIPHFERLGPIDYFTTMKWCVGDNEPTPDSVSALKQIIQFVNDWTRSGMVLQLECGTRLQGLIPELYSVDVWMEKLQDHEAVLAGMLSKDEWSKKNSSGGPNGGKEGRHTGTREGKMKSTFKKLEKDISKDGIKRCENVACDKVENYARQFATCSRCGFAAYCCRDCQKTDWKRHKKECKDKAIKAEEEKFQNRSKDCLMVGESQQVLSIINYWLHFAAKSDEMKATQTENATIIIHAIAPKIAHVEMWEYQFGMQEVTFLFKAIWSMTPGMRYEMTRKFVKATSKLGFPKGGPDFSMTLNWSKYGVGGDFAVVKYTPKGAILLHEDVDGTVKGYVAVGITQSLQSIVSQMEKPLPIFLTTGVFPFKKMILCQGTFMPVTKFTGLKLSLAANAFVSGDESGIEVLERI